MGKRNPVKPVSAVVKRKSAVVAGNLFEANIPPTTISPLPIATRVIMTCKIVKAPTDIPRIMESPLVGVLARKPVRHGREMINYRCAATMSEMKSRAGRKNCFPPPNRARAKSRTRSAWAAGMGLLILRLLYENRQ
jgi:hypothetical protein